MDKRTIKIQIELGGTGYADDLAPAIHLPAPDGSPWVLTADAARLIEPGSGESREAGVWLQRGPWRVRVVDEPDLEDNPDAPSNSAAPRLDVATTDGEESKRFSRSLRREEGERVVVGRREGDIRLPDRTVSGRHLEFFIQGASVWVRDLEPMNPSSVNGEPLEPRKEVRLRDGDQVQLGRSIVRVHDPLNSSRPAEWSGTREPLSSTTGGGTSSSVSTMTPAKKKPETVAQVIDDPPPRRPGPPSPLWAVVFACLAIAILSLLWALL